MRSFLMALWDAAERGTEDDDASLSEQYDEWTRPSSESTGA